MSLGEKLRKQLETQQKNQENLLQADNSIHLQLERLRAIQEKKVQPQAALPVAQGQSCELGGQVQTNPAGSFLYFSTTLDVCAAGGSEVLPPDSKSVLSLLELLLGVTPAQNLGDVVFLDTETTGLAGGTGTYAFLVGLGEWRPEGFCVEQFFMRDYHEEQAMLHALRDRLAQARVVVTFNGKTFDLPLLESRYVLARQPWPLSGAPHLDLLHPARRLWKLRLGACTLGNLEKQLLGVSRDNDVPGQLIPALYFNYTRTGIPRGIQAILKHNQQDIKTLADLTALVGQVLLSDPNRSTLSGEDLFSAGKYFRVLRRNERSWDYDRAALQTGLPDELRLEALKRMADVLRSQRAYDQAASLWETIFSSSTRFCEELCENLAIHYEHRAKQIARALELVEYALAQISQTAASKARTARQKRWEKRRTRLLRKLAPVDISE